MNRRTAFDDHQSESVPTKLYVRVDSVVGETVELTVRVIGPNGLSVVRERMVLGVGEAVVLPNSYIRMEVAEG